MPKRERKREKVLMIESGNLSLEAEEENIFCHFNPKCKQ